MGNINSRHKYGMTGVDWIELTQGRFFSESEESWSYIKEIFKQLINFSTKSSPLFYVSLTVHPGIIPVNDQFDALFSIYLFILSTLYMFRARGVHHQER
jgi:hypothetical protein